MSDRDGAPGHRPAARRCRDDHDVLEMDVVEMDVLEMTKTIVCLCHDVRIEDIDRAVAQGYTDPETIKRFTAALMGPCQGKACADQVMDAIAARLGVERTKLRAPTSRPPAFPVRLGQLTGGPVVDP